VLSSDEFGSSVERTVERGVERGARAAFDALAPSHCKEHVRAIDEAKKPETRAKRVAACAAKVSG